MLMRMEQSAAQILGFQACGRLTDNDYKNFLIPEVQTAINDYGQVRLLFHFDHFRGWDVWAAWDDLRFGLEINRNVEKIAIVGVHQWESWGARLMNMFVHAQVFPISLMKPGSG